MTDVPAPWEFFLLAVAGFYLWYLIGEASILDRPRDWAVKRLGEGFAALIECSWCCGTWIALVGYLAWLAFPSEIMHAAVVGAAAGVIGFLGTIFHALISD